MHLRKRRRPPLRGGGGLPTRLDDNVRHEICAGQSTRVVETASSLPRSDYSCTAAVNAERGGRLNHGFGGVDEMCVGWNHRHVVRVFYCVCPLAFVSTGVRS